MIFKRSVNPFKNSSEDERDHSPSSSFSTNDRAQVQPPVKRQMPYLRQAPTQQNLNSHLSSDRPQKEVNHSESSDSNEKKLGDLMNHEIAIKNKYAQSPSIADHHENPILEELEIEEPETIIGEGVSLKGELSFERYLCINGEFEGDLRSKGKVKVGKSGVIRSNLHLHSAVIEGKVLGDIVIEDLLELRGTAQVCGNIRARYLRVDDGVMLNGHVQILPQGLKQISEATLFDEE